MSHDRRECTDMDTLGVKKRTQHGGPTIRVRWCGSTLFNKGHRPIIAQGIMVGIYHDA